MSTFAVYDESEGKILQVVDSPDGMMVCGPGESFLKLNGYIDPDTHYVNKGALTKRPLLPARISGNLLINVPPGSKVYIEDSVYEADGSTLELDFTLPGEYTIRVRAWPYLDWECTYEAKA